MPRGSIVLNIYCIPSVSSYSTSYCISQARSQDFVKGIHYVHIDPCQLRNCNYVIGEYACAKYLGVGKNDCVNTTRTSIIVLKHEAKTSNNAR